MSAVLQDDEKDDDLFQGTEALAPSGQRADGVDVSFLVPDDEQSRELDTTAEGSGPQKKRGTEAGFKSDGRVVKEGEGVVEAPLDVQETSAILTSSELLPPQTGKEQVQSNGEGDSRKRSGSKSSRRRSSSRRKTQYDNVGFKTMAGFMRGAAQKERIAVMKKHDRISNYELLTLRKAFSYAPKASEATNGGVDEIRGEHVRTVIERMSIDCSDRLLEVLKQECPFYTQDLYDMADMMQIFVGIKRVQYVKLPSSTPWVENRTVQTALKTKHFLVDEHRRTAWNFFMLVLACVQWWVVFYRDGASGLEREIDAGFVAADFFFSITTAIDIYLWCNTAVVHRSQIKHVDTSEKIRNHYWRTWLVPDILSALPLDVICCLAGASIPSGIFSHFRLIRAVRTLSFWAITGYTTPTKGYIFFYFGLLPLLKIIAVGFLLLHSSAVGFWLVKQATGNVADLDNSPYVGAIYFVVQTFSTVGYGDIQLRGPAELWFTIILVFFALLTNGLIIGKLVSLLQLQSAENVREDRLRETLAVLEFFDIPTQLQSEILNFQDHVLWSKAETTFYDTIHQLPKTIIENVDLLRRISIIATVPFFADGGEALMVTVARSLQSRTSKPEEYVTCSSDTHQGIRWLLFGYVDQLDPSGRYISTLKGGDFFGLIGLLDSEDESFNYKALSYCDLLIFPNDDFHKLCVQFPQFGAEAESYLIEFEDKVSETSVLNGGVRRSSESSSGSSPRTGILGGQTTGNTGHSNKIVALRNLHTKLRNYKESLIMTRQGLLSGNVDEPT